MFNVSGVVTRFTLPVIVYDAIIIPLRWFLIFRHGFSLQLAVLSFCETVRAK
jgi:hypothetical protein